MVKGISRQVIVLEEPDPRLFDQAIFILKDDALGEGVTDEQLLKEARQLIRGGPGKQQKKPFVHRLLWTALGASLTGGAWAVSLLL